jgi:glycosyltransferase involved in cell wall biosynthesis
VTPQISVVMPVYNAVDLVSDAIDSILQQSFQDFELIIVEDGSDDGTRDVVIDRAKDDSRIRVFEIARTSDAYTAAQARAFGMAQARGGYIAAQDADDLSLPDRLKTELAWLKRHDLDVVGGQVDVFGRFDGHYWFPETHDAICIELSFRPALFETTKLAKVQVMRNLPYPPGSHEDYAWLVRAMAAGVRMGNIPETMARHRDWGGQISKRQPAEQRTDYRRYRFEHCFAQHAGLTLPGFNVIDKIAARLALTSKDELTLAAEWLVRLSRYPDPKLHARMQRRWTETYVSARIDVAPDWRATIAARIGL